jgi:solute carrier family 25 S-adenosylmethionine transporter 26
MPEEKKDSPFTMALIAGGIAGTTVDVALHPIDTLRCRLQSQEGFMKAGGFKGMYRGIGSAALGSAPGAAAFFSTYETGKKVLRNMSGGQEASWHHATASSCGEVAACLVRVPTAVVTQRQQVGQYATMAEAVKGTYRQGGLSAFYSGYFTMVAREIPFAFIQFPIYEGLKSKWSTYQGSQVGPLQGAMCGSIAGATAGAFTTPLDVAKTRIMLEDVAEGQARRYSGTVATLKLIVAEEGPTALFKGIGARVTWITFGGFIFFGAYEFSTKGLWMTGVWG